MDSTSKELELKPFWNAQCAAIASNLWLPTVTDWQDLATNSFNKLLSKTLDNSWFSTSLLIRQSTNLPTMLSFAHYRFKQFIKHKAFEYGKRVVDVNESYTSKTHPETGEIRNIGGAKLIKLLSGKWVNRDLVGARNILLRALVDTPQSADWQLIIT